MYRDGGEALIWGEPVQTRIVGSREEEMEALAEGWRFHPLKALHPLDHDGDGKKGGSLPRRQRKVRARSDEQ